MSARRKIMFAFLVVAVVFLILIDTAQAYKVSAGAACKKPNSDPDAVRFYNKIKSFPSWTGNFYKKYGSLKEKYYGKDNHKWIDKSDIHYHVGHGGNKWDWGYWRTLRAIIFDGSAMVPSEARRKWGNQNLEWIGFRCCQLLNNNSRRYWAGAMNKLHLILGFKTNSYKHDNFGKIWAEQMKLKKTVKQAWFVATDRTQPKGVVARVLAETSACFSDRLWRYGYVSSDPRVDSRYYYSDHSAGSPEYLSVNHLSEMFIYEVVQRQVNEAYVQQIADAFGLAAESITETDDAFIISRPYTTNTDPNDPNNGFDTLEVLKNSGRYYYHDTGRLWLPDLNIGGFYSDPLGRAGQFLTDNGLMPSDTGASAVEYEYITSQDTNDVAPEPNQTYPQSCCAVYARRLEAGLGGDHVSVAGPGAKLKVYIRENGGIIGCTGNWRNVQATSTVPVITKEEAWDLYSQYGERVAICPIIVDYNRKETDLNTATQAYYEYSALHLQTTLIPVWIFKVDYYDGEDLLTTADAFIPAVQSFVPPVAGITEPGDASEFLHGENIRFRCSAVPGLGTPPYTYQWESDVDGLLSTEPNFKTCSLGINCISDGNTCEILPHTVSLTITDSQGLNSTDSIQVTIQRLAGDINCDGIIDFKDVALMSGQWLQAATLRPVGHWRFDEGQGIIAADIGTGGNDCTLMGDPQWVAGGGGGAGGCALDFDGDGDYVKTADTTSDLDFAPGSFSVSTWINAREATGGWRAILEYDRYGNYRNWFGIWLSSAGKFHFRVGLDTKDSDQTLNSDEWYLLTGTYDAASRLMSLYINEQLDSSATQNTGYQTPCSAKLTIGVRGWEDAEYFDGRIDDVRIYDYCLSLEQIQDLYE